MFFLTTLKALKSIFWLTSFLAHLKWALSVIPCRCCCRRRSKLFTFSSYSPEPLGQFQPNSPQNILRWREFKFVQMKGHTLFQWEIKIHWQNLKIFFSRTAWPISTKLGTKHPWVLGIQVWPNEGQHPFPRVDNYEIAKIHRRNLKFVSRTAGSKHSWLKKLKVLQIRTIQFSKRR